MVKIMAKETTWCHACHKYTYSISQWNPVTRVLYIHQLFYYKTHWILNKTWCGWCDVPKKDSFYYDGTAVIRGHLTLGPKESNWFYEEEY